MLLSNKIVGLDLALFSEMVENHCCQVRTTLFLTISLFLFIV